MVVSVNHGRTDGEPSVDSASDRGATAKFTGLRTEYRAGNGRERVGSTHKYGGRLQGTGVICVCGITGRIGDGDAVSELLTGLKNLEYRGYDSAGLAVRNGHGIEVRKREGEIDRLLDVVDARPVDGTVGIGHTRWSTHGPPSDDNAHPHTDCEGRVAVVHNGIIDNYAELRSELADRGHRFTSDTDTEVVPHLIEERLATGDTPEEAFRRAVERISGSYALAMVVDGHDAIYATRDGSPLVLGIADDVRYLASDVPAFLEYTDEVIFLDDGDVAIVRPADHEITDANGSRADRPIRAIDWDPEDAGKGGYDHYMEKEIHEQPTALGQTIRGRVSPDEGAVRLEDVPEGSFADVERVQFLGCGTSYHAALYGTRLLASRGVPARAFLAGEYATVAPPIEDDTLVVGVTQSGETADTLSALEHANEQGARTLALTNVVGSSATRQCDESLFIRAGPEIGVAATKTFSSQVATLALLAERIAADGRGEPDGSLEFLEAISRLPRHVQTILNGSQAPNLAHRFHGSDAYFFIGRSTGYPVALEGALKLKEITYEHAEGFAAAELKHGPLALVTTETPVFAVFSGRDDERTLGNVKEVEAREAPVVAVAPEGTPVERYAEAVLTIPDTHRDVAGILANVQLQLLSYHAATLRDRPVDKPRNLAKSVTVE